MENKIPTTKNVLQFLEELRMRGVIKNWEKVFGNNDEYIIKFNIAKF